MDLEKLLETLEDQELKENVEVMRNLQDVILELKVHKCAYITIHQNTTLWILVTVTFALAIIFNFLFTVLGLGGKKHIVPSYWLYLEESGQMHLQNFMIYLSFLFFFSFKNESSGIAASIDAMAAGEDEAELSRSGSKNEADESPSVRWQFYRPCIISLLDCLRNSYFTKLQILPYLLLFSEPNVNYRVFHL